MKKILIAEDDPFILDLASEKLMQKGYVVEKTADGGSIMQKIDETKPDLLLLDLMLPNAHGFEVLQEIRADETKKDLPVIVFSNETGTDTENRAQALGAHYFFKAMTGTGELVAKVEEVLT